MARSDAQICNMALARIGIKTFIDDLSDTDIEEAETCNVFYADMRDACLAAFPWPFATLRAALALAGDEQERDGWAYVFKLPDGCLAPRKIWPAGTVTRNPRSDQRIPYAIEKATNGDGQVLLTDEPSPILFYTSRIEDPAKFPPLFVDALAWLLAGEMAMPLTAKPALEEAARKRYLGKIGEARAEAFNEEQEDQPPETESIAARR
jgi:hypothetical protein